MKRKIRLKPCDAESKTYYWYDYDKIQRDVLYSWFPNDYPDDDCSDLAYAMDTSLSFYFDKD